MTTIDTDLNQAIVSAINAKVEAGVLAALAGDEVLGKYVAAALNEPIEIPKNGSSYDRIKTTYLRHTIDLALRDAVKAAVAKFIEGEKALIEAEVAKALRKHELRLNVGRFADSIEQDRYFDAIDLALDGKTLLLAFINEPRVHSRVLVMEIEGLRLTKFLEHPKFPTERFESTVNRIAEHWNVVEGQVKVVQLSGAISETIAALKESTRVDNPSLRERSIHIFYYLSKLLPIYWERNHTE